MKRPAIHQQWLTCTLFSNQSFEAVVRYIFLVAGCLAAVLAQAQKKNSGFRYNMRHTTGPVIIDGKMDEPAWQATETATDFAMVLPMDTSLARVHTDVKMTYDSQFLYIIAVCWLNKPGPYMVESLRRDFNFGKNDNFIFFIDPFDDRTNGFTFGANAAGAQWDGMLYDGGKADLSWDNKWFSEVMYYEDKWIFEAAIPFQTIRYKKGNKEWGINFSRLDIKVAEKSAWAPVPRQFPTASLAYTGSLVWDEAPPDAGLNISLIPYALGGVSKDYENKQAAVYKGEVGADAKIGITSSLNLDLTVNPDFSQVEVDRQVTNLDRFELFFPERRQFFLENNDLFGNFGYQNIRPFFSRRIGLDAPISFGARLSGSLNKNWRIGAMDMQTKAVDESGLPVQNFAVLALQRKVFSRSNIRLMFVNKESINYEPGKDTTVPQYSAYNRNFGIEYNLASSNNLWTGKAMFVKSFSPGVNNNDIVHAANLKYANRKWTISWQHEFVGKSYSAEVGYVPRNNYVKLNPQVNYLFFPKKGKILSHGPQLGTTYYFNQSFQHTDDETYLYYGFTKRNQTTFGAWIAYDYVELLQPFDPTNSGKDSLPTGSKHNWMAFGGDYVSKPQQLFTFNLSARYGGYYADGRRLFFSGDFGYRFQPFVSLSLSSSFNHIDLPEPWGQTTFWLIGPRIDVTFTNTLFFTTFLQYNDQQQNINLNTRFQWRYRPASDLFLVYTDNYFPSPVKVRNRAFVLKFTYWWNM